MHVAHTCIFHAYTHPSYTLSSTLTLIACMHIHICMHACIHTHVHTYIHTYILSDCAPEIAAHRRRAIILRRCISVLLLLCASAAAGAGQGEQASMMKFLTGGGTAKKQKVEECESGDCESGPLPCSFLSLNVNGLKTRVEQENGAWLEGIGKLVQGTSVHTFTGIYTHIPISYVYTIFSPLSLSLSLTHTRIHTHARTTHLSHIAHAHRAGAGYHSHARGQADGQGAAGREKGRRATSVCCSAPSPCSCADQLMWMKATSVASLLCRPTCRVPLESSLSRAHAMSVAAGAHTLHHAETHCNTLQHTLHIRCVPVTGSATSPGTMTSCWTGSLYSEKCWTRRPGATTLASSHVQIGAMQAPSLSLKRGYGSLSDSTTTLTWRTAGMTTTAECALRSTAVGCDWRTSMHLTMAGMKSPTLLRVVTGTVAC